MTTFSQILAFSESSEGRDRALKFLQYFTSLLRVVWISRYTINFHTISAALENTRKVFRVGRTFTDLYVLTEVYNSKRIDTPQKVFQILRRFSLAIRWIFDSLNVLSLFKILKLNAKDCLRLATAFWLIALLFNLMDCIREMMKSYAKEESIKDQAIGKPTVWVIKKLDKLSEIRRVYVLEMTRTLGDIVIASNGAEIPYSILGKQFSKKWVAIAGMVASCINCRQTWAKISLS